MDDAPDPPTCYDEAYYRTHLGPDAYGRQEPWLSFFAGMAAEIIRALHPGRVFDAGCAMGLLVEALWDRGVVAHGRDISGYAISCARPDIRDFLEVGSVTDPVEGAYDLVTCIEVLEHLPLAASIEAIAMICSAAPLVLFSSSPDDFAEATHVNVRPPIWWMERFAEHGFHPVVTFDASFVAPHALLLAREECAQPEVLRRAQADILRLRGALGGRDRTIATLQECVGALQGTVGTLQGEAEAFRATRERWEEERRALDRDLAALRERHQAELQDWDLDRLALSDAERREAGARGQALASQAARDEALRAAAGFRADIRNLEIHAATLGRLRDALLDSSCWKLTWPARLVAERLPGPVRRSLSRGLRIVWWGVTGQLGARLQRRRLVVEIAQRIEGSELFDAAWYARTYPGIAGSGLAPAVHYVAHGAAQGKNPGPRFDTRFYMEQAPRILDAYQVNPLLHYLEQGAREGRLISRPNGAVAIEHPEAVPVARRSSTAADQRARRFPALAPLRIVSEPRLPGRRRLNIVTDSISEGSLYGGVLTSLVFGVLLAERLEAELRLVTRTEAGHAGAIAEVLAVHRVHAAAEIDLFHLPPETERPLPVHEGDLFLTTAWWCTRPVIQAVDPSRVLELVQEDERMFYPQGDERLLCTEVLGDTRFGKIVNSEMLFRHFAQQGVLGGPSRYFEPAFPSSALDEAGMRARHERRHYHLLFYARPVNARNLYYRGLDALTAALEKGVFEDDAWAITFVGRELEPVELPGGIRPRILQNLAWQDYSQLIRRTDLGLSLMDTPHPSYPPIDMGTSGAICVTNRNGPKSSLDAYSGNILCVDASVSGLVSAFETAVARVRDVEARVRNARGPGLHTEWKDAMRPALDWAEGAFA